MVLLSIGHIFDILCRQTGGGVGAAPKNSFFDGFEGAIYSIR